MSCTPRALVPAALLAILLAACGGGGGGGTDAAPNQAPVAAAALSGEAVLQATTSFNTTGTGDPDGTITGRSWAYGDGQTGSEDSHVYTAAGSYTAVYTVTDNRGATNAKTVPVTVSKCSAAGTEAARLSPHATVCVRTSRGEMVFEVYTGTTPVTAANFLAYVGDSFYNGTLIHRVVPGFVIQGGGYTTGLVERTPTRPPIALENRTGLKNWQYTLAMARTSVPASATSQFFINLVDNPGLDYSAATGGENGYAVFGQVISGTEVVDQTGAVPTATLGGLQNVPSTEIIIRSIIRMP